MVRFFARMSAWSFLTSVAASDTIYPARPFRIEEAVYKAYAERGLVL